MKDEMQEMTWNQKTAAYVAGTTERTLRNWNSLENPPPCIPGRRGKPAVYPAQEFVAWLIEFRLGQITGSADAGDPQQMRARLDRLRGDAVELDLKVKSGEFAPIDTIRDVLGDVASQIKAILESLPRKIKNAQPALNARSMRIIHSEIIKAMNACSEVRVEFDTTNDSWD